MALKERLYTNEEFWAFTDLAENADKSFELIHGVVVEMPSASFLHGLIIARITHFIMAYLLNNQIGYVVGDGYDFVLDEGLIFRPDAAYVAKGHFTEFPKRCDFSPDIAVEVVSPSNTPHELMRKVDAYLEFGSKQVWMVYPEDKTLYVYHPLEDGSINLRKYTATDTLDGGDVLPGFSVSVSDLFPEITA